VGVVVIPAVDDTTTALPGPYSTDITVKIKDLSYSTISSNVLTDAATEAELTFNIEGAEVEVSKYCSTPPFILSICSVGVLASCDCGNAYFTD
jgi:hypothetical protein